MYGYAQSYPSGGNHEDLVAAIAQFLEPRVYVELGVANGETFKKVFKYVREIATAVDLEDRRFDAPYGEAKFVYFKGDTREYLRSQEDMTIDLAFLDSSHEEQDTLEEFELLDAKVRDNGVVLLHDAYPPDEIHAVSKRCGYVWRAVHALKERYRERWEFCTLPSEFGVAVARKNLGRQIFWED